LRRVNNALCLLLGLAPQDLSARLGGGKIPLAPPATGVGIPADLVRRRPDVRRAERQVAAQSALIGLAESDYYPHISIVGNIGVGAEDFSDLFKATAGFGSIGPSFHWDILNYGRIE